MTRYVCLRMSDVGIAVAKVKNTYKTYKNNSKVQIENVKRNREIENSEKPRNSKKYLRTYDRFRQLSLAGVRGEAPKPPAAILLQSRRTTSKGVYQA